MVEKNTFKQQERLKSRKELGLLFEKGHSLTKYPFRLVWMEMEERKSDAPVQFAVGVSKKKFSKAVTRNKIKRIIREVYRLNKNSLYQIFNPEDPQIAFLVLFTGQELLPFPEMKKAMKKLIQKFEASWLEQKKI